MPTKTLLIISFIIIYFAGFSSAQEKPLRCPNTTVYKRVKILPGRAEKTNYFALYEEFCQQRMARGFVKRGPYRLWGPNGEVIIQGQFAKGKKTGTWTRWLPSGTVEEAWQNDKLIEAKVREARPVQIDYEACVPQNGMWNWGDGFSSTTYEVLGAAGKYCKVRYAHIDWESIFPSDSKWTNCRVPRSKKKNALTASENDLYCEKF